MKPLVSLTSAAALAATLAVAPAALAHAHLEASAPAAKSVVAPPAVLKLDFSEKLEPRFSTVELKTAAGAPAPIASTAKGKTITATPKAKLAPGAYTVVWKALSADGHKSNGEYGFTVK